MNQYLNPIRKEQLLTKLQAINNLNKYVRYHTQLICICDTKSTIAFYKNSWRNQSIDGQKIKFIFFNINNPQGKDISLGDWIDTDHFETIIEKHSFNAKNFHTNMIDDGQYLYCFILIINLNFITILIEKDTLRLISYQYNSPFIHFDNKTLSIIQLISKGKLLHIFASEQPNFIQINQESITYQFIYNPKQSHKFKFIIKTNYIPAFNFKPIISHDDTLSTFAIKRKDNNNNVKTLEIINYENNTWTPISKLLCNSLPTLCIHSSCIISKRYIIMFDTNSTNIYAFDIQTQSFMQTGYRMPGPFGGVSVKINIWRNKDKEMILVSGYEREIMKNQLQNITTSPNFVKYCIGLYYSNDSLFIIMDGSMNNNTFSLLSWNISIDKLLEPILL